MHFNRIMLTLFACTLFQYQVKATQFQLFDLGKVLAEPGHASSYATSINDNGQVVCFTDPNRTWFIWHNGLLQKNIVHFQGSISGLGCPPYINNSGVVSKEYNNDSGQSLCVRSKNFIFFQIVASVIIGLRSPMSRMRKKLSKNKKQPLMKYLW